MPRKTEPGGRLFQKPQVNLVQSTPFQMWLVSLCAFLSVLQSSLTDSFASLIIALFAVTGAAVTEFLFHIKDPDFTLKDGSAVASALLFTLLLPNQLHPVYAFFGAIFAMAVVKHSFGGLGSNWLNPAAAGWLFVRFSHPAAFAEALKASPLSRLSAGSLSPAGVLENVQSQVPGGEGLTSMEGIIRTFLNRTIFSLARTELPPGYMDLFSSPYPGIIADRGLLGLLLGTVIIIACRAGRLRIPALYLLVFGFLVRLAGALPYGGKIGEGDVLFALLSGGTIAAAFFLASEPVTGAKSGAGILLLSLAGGALAWLFRYWGREPYGVVFAVIVLNCVAPWLRKIESRLFYEKRGAL